MIPIASQRLCLLLALACPCASADSMRCGSQLVSTGDSVWEVEGKCGPPISRDFQGYLEQLDEWGFYQEVEVERWTYGPHNGMYHYLRFEGRRLTDIDSQRGP